MSQTKLITGNTVRVANIPENLPGHIHNGTVVVLGESEDWGNDGVLWKVTPELMNPATNHPFSHVEEIYLEPV